MSAQPHVMLAIMPKGNYAKMASRDKRYQSYGQLNKGWTLPQVLYDYKQCCVTARLPEPRVTVVQLLEGGLGKDGSPRVA